jgi:hypothetical protein
MIHYRAGMGVELSKALNILAHELRGPLGVIQGYLRLLRQRRTESEDETRMLTVMQDASGRIAALGRQAVELAGVLEHPLSNEPSAPLAAVLDAAVQQAGLSTPPTVELPEAIAQTPVRCGSSPAVPAAFAAMVQAVAKDSPGTPIAIVAAPAGADRISLKMGPIELVTDGEPTAAGSDAPEHLRLARGGLGLSLVLASYALEAIDAQLSSLGPDGSALVVTLRKDGGFR